MSTPISFIRAINVGSISITVISRDARLYKLDEYFLFQSFLLFFFPYCVMHFLIFLIIIFYFLLNSRQLTREVLLPITKVLVIFGILQVIFFSFFGHYIASN